MSKHRLKVTLTDQPAPDAAVSTRKVSIRSRIASKLLGNPQQLTVLVPGNQVRSVEIIRPDDDLMALARAVGVTRSGVIPRERHRS
ncbi:hypothetical protein R3J22_04335 [Trueperella bernardiae]|uniref:hypothetical protein n=1 Tax=Trueperella bernardiae TaxID=59561 RepID=UPI00294A936E|nr:hypothetical protein [Trueperella bernardiae]MDV6238758.1 hypothetical protein [Trueperella bernardiae]